MGCYLTSGRLQSLEVCEVKELNLEDLESLIHSHRKCLKRGLWGKKKKEDYDKHSLDTVTQGNAQGNTEVR